MRQERPRGLKRRAFAVSLYLALMGFSILGSSLLGSSLIGFTPVYAQDQSERLNTLFKALHDAPDAEIARQIANRIQMIWSKPKNPTADLFMKKAAEAMNADDVPVAIELLDRVITIEPEFTEGWNRRATAFYMLEDYTRSLSDVMETLQREPRHFGALTGLGLILIERGELMRAREAFAKALDIYPLLETAKDAIESIDRQTGATQL